MEKDAGSSTIASRLREERERIGLSQTDFGAAGGIKKRAQINYEQGEGAPVPEYWAGIARIGADVQYILAGVRSLNLNKVAEGSADHQAQGVGAVSREEAGIIEMYRELKPGDRPTVRALFNAFASKDVKKDETGS